MREKTIYEKIAEKYNTTPEEIRREMQIAIDAGFDNPDPAVQEEWKKMTLKGIRVNAVAPGITETDMMKAVPKEVIEPMIERIPLRRLGQPEDIAND